MLIWYSGSYDRETGGAIVVDFWSKVLQPLVELVHGFYLSSPPQFQKTKAHKESDQATEYLLFRSFPIDENRVRPQTVARRRDGHRRKDWQMQETLPIVVHNAMSTRYGNGCHV